MAEERRMSFVDDENRDTMEKALQMVDRNVYIANIDYARGVVVLGYRYDNYPEENWLEVNVACDSVPAILHDVFNKAYDKLMY